MEMLPKEVLIEIFAYQNFNELCHLTSTCKLFNEIINNKSTLVDNFRLVFNKRWKIKVDFWLRKKYRRILIETVDDNLLKYLKCFGDNICDIKMQCYEVELKDLRTLLTLCPNVKQLYIDIRFINHSDDDLTKPVIKLTLDSLTIHYCGCDISKFLQISAEKINVNVAFEESLSRNTLLNLLKIQKHLKTLHLDMQDDYFQLINDNSLVNVDFRLKTLIAGYFLFDNSNVENFKEFLKNQKSLLKFIDGDKYYACHYEYAEIRENLQIIKELKVTKIYNYSHSMSYIEKLAIYVPRDDKTSLNIHDLFPNVNDLCIDAYNKFKFVENFTESTSKDCAEFKILENVKTLRLKDYNYKNDSLFDDDVDIKIENLIIYRTGNINWLIDCFKKDRIKLKSLKIGGTNIKKSQQEYLESLTRGDDKKIDKLKIYMWMKFNENHDYVFDYLTEDDVGAKRIKIE